MAHNGSGPGYPQRTDLQRVQVTPPTGQTYGKATQQQQSAQTVPAGIPKLPAFNRPTERPQEPLTAGMAQGPGPGPEALAPLPGMGNQTLDQADIEYLRPALPALEKMADLSNSSPTFRAWVQSLRGEIRAR